MSVPHDRILGAYRLIEQVGRGGMGEVYRAQHLRLGREAAVKVLPINLAGDPELLRRFEREAASAASLEHPHIVPIWEYGEHAGTPYLVMPLLRGGSLKEKLQHGPLPPQAIVGYLSQMAEALDYAHERGIVHRDVKPANMLLDDRGRLYLSDFGIAKALEGSEGLTRTGVGIGTPEYMAPEQAQGRADSRSDLYALGVTLYQMVTGRVPYSGNSTVEVLMKHMQEPLPLVPLQNAPQLPPSVVGVSQKALAKNPNERYQTGRAIVDAVAEAFAARPVADTGATIVSPIGDRTIVAPVTPSGWGQTAPPAGSTTPPPGGAPVPGWPGPPSSTAQLPPLPPPQSHLQPRPRRNLAPLIVGGLVGLLALLLICGSVSVFALTRPDTGATATAGANATSTVRIIAAATGTSQAVATATANAPTATPVPPTPTPSPVPPTRTPTTAPTATVAVVPTAPPTSTRPAPTPPRATATSPPAAGNITITVSPAEGPAGTKFVFVGQGLKAGDTISYGVAGPNNTSTSDTIQLNPNQTSFRLTLSTDGAPPGRYAIVFLQGDGSNAATLFFTVQ